MTGEVGTTPSGFVGGAGYFLRVWSISSILNSSVPPVISWFLKGAASA